MANHWGKQQKKRSIQLGAGTTVYFPPTCYRLCNQNKQRYQISNNFSLLPNFWVQKLPDWLVLVAPTPALNPPGSRWAPRNSLKQDGWRLENLIEWFTMDMKWYEWESEVSKYIKFISASVGFQYSTSICVFVYTKLRSKSLDPRPLQWWPRGDGLGWTMSLQCEIYSNLH
jgi:hypothetical protein